MFVVFYIAGERKSKKAKKDVDFIPEEDEDSRDVEPGEEGKVHIGDVTQKGSLCPESVSYQKGRGHAHPSIFWYGSNSRHKGSIINGGGRRKNRK